MLTKEWSKTKPTHCTNSTILAGNILGPQRSWWNTRHPPDVVSRVANMSHHRPKHNMLQNHTQLGQPDNTLKEFQTCQSMPSAYQLHQWTLANIAIMEHHTPLTSTCSPPFFTPIVGSHEPVKNQSRAHHLRRSSSSSSQDGTGGTAPTSSRRRQACLQRLLQQEARH